MDVGLLHLSVDRAGGRGRLDVCCWRGDGSIPKFDRRDAIFAAVLYAVNPYHLVIVYWRSAFAELLASCLVPLLLLCRAEGRGRGHGVRSCPWGLYWRRRG